MDIDQEGDTISPAGKVPLENLDNNTPAKNNLLLDEKDDTMDESSCATPTAQDGTLSNSQASAKKRKRNRRRKNKARLGNVEEPGGDSAGEVQFTTSYNYATVLTQDMSPRDRGASMSCLSTESKTPELAQANSDCKSQDCNSQPSFHSSKHDKLPSAQEIGYQTHSQVQSMSNHLQSHSSKPVSQSDALLEASKTKSGKSRRARKKKKLQALREAENLLSDGSLTFKSSLTASETPTSIATEDEVEDIADLSCSEDANAVKYGEDEPRCVARPTTPYTVDELRNEEREEIVILATAQEVSQDPIVEATDAGHKLNVTYDIETSNDRSVIQGSWALEMREDDDAESLSFSQQGLSEDNSCLSRPDVETLEPDAVQTPGELCGADLSRITEASVIDDEVDSLGEEKTNFLLDENGNIIETNDRHVNNEEGDESHDVDSDIQDEKFTDDHSTKSGLELSNKGKVTLEVPIEDSEMCKDNGEMPTGGLEPLEEEPTLVTEEPEPDERTDAPVALINETEIRTEMPEVSTREHNISLKERKTTTEDLETSIAEPEPQPHMKEPETPIAESVIQIKESGASIAEPELQNEETETPKPSGEAEIPIEETETINEHEEAAIVETGQPIEESEASFVEAEMLNGGKEKPEQSRTLSGDSQMPIEKPEPPHEELDTLNQEIYTPNEESDKLNEETEMLINEFEAEEPKRPIPEPDSTHEEPEITAKDSEKPNENREIPNVGMGIPNEESEPKNNEFKTSMGDLEKLNKEPGVAMEEPDSTTNEELEVTAKEFEMANKEPETANEQSKTSNHESEMPNEESETLNGDSEVSNEKAGMQNGELETSSEDSEMPNEEVGMTSEELGTPTYELETRVEESEVRMREPEFTLEPEITLEKTEVATAEPVISLKEPEIIYEGTKISSEKTLTSIDELEIFTEMREISPKESDFTANDFEISSGETERTKQESEMTKEEPEMSFEKPKITIDEPEMPIEQPKMTSEEPEMTMEEPEMTMEEHEVPIAEPETPIIEHKMTIEEPEITIKEPEMTTKEPEMTTKEPEMTMKEPEITTEEPEMTVKEPEISTEEPEMPTEESEMTMEEPEVPIEESEMTMKEPEVPIEEVQMPIEEPEMPIEETKMPIEKPEVQAEESEMSSEEPEITIEEPEIPLKEHEMTIKEPEMPLEEPEKTIKESEMPLEEPEKTLEEPEMTFGEPKMAKEEPKMPIKVPGTPVEFGKLIQGREFSELEYKSEELEIREREHRAWSEELEIAPQKHEISLEEHDISPEEIYISPEEHDMSHEESEVSSGEPEITIVENRKKAEMSEFDEPEIVTEEANITTTESTNSADDNKNFPEMLQIATEEFELVNNEFAISFSSIEPVTPACTLSGHPEPDSDLILQQNDEDDCVAATQIEDKLEKAEHGAEPTPVTREITAAYDLPIQKEHAPLEGEDDNQELLLSDSLHASHPTESSEDDCEPQPFETSDTESAAAEDLLMKQKYPDVTVVPEDNHCNLENRTPNSCSAKSVSRSHRGGVTFSDTDDDMEDLIEHCEIANHQYSDVKPVENEEKDIEEVVPMPMSFINTKSSVKVIFQVDQGLPPCALESVMLVDPVTGLEDGPFLSSPDSQAPVEKIVSDEPSLGQMWCDDDPADTACDLVMDNQRQEGQLPHGWCQYQKNPMFTGPYSTSVLHVKGVEALIDQAFIHEQMKLHEEAKMDSMIEDLSCCVVEELEPSADEPIEDDKAEESQSPASVSDSLEVPNPSFIDYKAEDRPDIDMRDVARLALLKREHPDVVSSAEGTIDSIIESANYVLESTESNSESPTYENEQELLDCDDNSVTAYADNDGHSGYENMPDNFQDSEPDDFCESLEESQYEDLGFEEQEHYENLETVGEEGEEFSQSLDLKETSISSSTSSAASVVLSETANLPKVPCSSNVNQIEFSNDAETIQSIVAKLLEAQESQRNNQEEVLEPNEVADKEPEVADREPEVAAVDEDLIRYEEPTLSETLQAVEEADIETVAVFDTEGNIVVVDDTKQPSECIPSNPFQVPETGIPDDLENIPDTTASIDEIKIQSDQGSISSQSLSACEKPSLIRAIFTCFGKRNRVKSTSKPLKSLESSKAAKKKARTFSLARTKKIGAGIT